MPQGGLDVGQAACLVAHQAGKGMAVLVEVDVVEPGLARIRLHVAGKAVHRQRPARCSQRLLFPGIVFCLPWQRHLRAGKEVYSRPDRARILNYGKIAYWLHARDNERYTDEWKALRVCR